MRVEDVMTERVETVAPTAAAADAWELMRQKGFHHLVVTTGPRVVGVLSDRDSGGRFGGATVSTRSVITSSTRIAALRDGAGRPFDQSPCIVHQRKLGSTLAGPAGTT